MATDCSELFVGLAVIINDWSEPSCSSAPTDNHAATTSNLRADAPAAVEQGVESPENNWRWNLDEMVEDFWTSVTSTVKRKVRKACVEVLRRTDEQEPASVECSQPDEAHLLD